MNRIFLLLFLLVASQQIALAECEIDNFGVVYCGRGNCERDRVGNIFCSKYLFGDALLTENGNVVCGKGRCLLSAKFNEIYCSSLESGGANRDRFGEVKCYGGCEKASALMCENQEGK